MSQFNPYSTAYSPQYPMSHASNIAPWNDSPDPSPLTPAANALADADDFFETFAEADQFFDSLPRLSSPRLPRDPLPLPLSTARQQPSQPIHLPLILPSYRLSSSPDPFDSFLELDPLERPEQLRAVTTSQNTRESTVVDLTESSPPNNTSTMPPRKRKAETPGEGRASKVTRASAPRSSRSTPAVQQKFESPEMVDLVDIDDDEKYEDFKAKQQAELIKQQQLDEATKPAKLAEFQCIICMDNPTDLTVTHCGMSLLNPVLNLCIIQAGHLFCSECLHQALYAGNAKKCCPVCRTAISTTLQGKEKRQPKNGVFVLEMKLMTARRGKRPA
jgi:hypothetical protein